MELLISLPTVVADKLHDLSLQELRPIALQAEYMLVRAILRARYKPTSAPQPSQAPVGIREPDHAPAP
jgi:hypothetical protein